MSKKLNPSEAQKLYDQGHGCNAIARKLGFAPSTISRWARANGLNFNREQTKKATIAKQVDLTVRRQELAERMLEAAHSALDQLGKPFLVYNFGGKDNKYASKILDTVPVDAQRQIMTTAGIAFDKASRIIERSTTGTEEAHGVLDQLALGFTQLAENYRNASE